jgi:hypothetical protein
MRDQRFDIGSDHGAGRVDHRSARNLGDTIRQSDDLGGAGISDRLETLGADPTNADESKSRPVSRCSGNRWVLVFF